MAVEPGYNGKVEVNSSEVLEMGAWSISGMENEMLPSTSFGDDFLEVTPGRGDGGIVTISGNYDPLDTPTGQAYLIARWIDKAAVTDLHLYFGDGDDDYFEKSAGNVYVVSIDGPSTDQAGLATIGFVCKLSGGYWKKHT